MESDKFSTVDSKDIEHHSKLASRWWDPNGALPLLHRMNDLRVPYIRDGLFASKKDESNLEELRILDVGCGGGLLTENLARLNVHVTALDASQELIDIAQYHLRECSPELMNRIDYKCDLIENYSKDNLEKFDAVVMSEVVEHVNNVEQFVQCCVDTVKPGGLIFITTLNRTIASLLVGIYVTEYVLNYTPRGTHKWSKFITPEEMEAMLEKLNCSTVSVKGYNCNLWKKQWYWTTGRNMFYALTAIKQ